MFEIDNELKHLLISVENFNHDMGTYEILLGVLKTPIFIEIRRSPTSDETHYRRSHSIKTPTQAGPYIQSRYWWDDPAYALHQAITSLTSYYDEAVKAGHKPQEAWLVKQDDVET